MMDARDFLEAVSGYTKNSGAQSSAERPVRLGTLDPSYTSGLARVQFDGDSAVSSKGYAWAASYFPKAGDRVYLIPVGNSYMIGGAVQTIYVAPPMHRRAEFTTTNWSVAAQAWDSGPVTLDTTPTRTKNNDFCKVGPLSGSIEFTKTGYYEISLYIVPRSGPGLGWTALTIGSERLAQTSNSTSVWETYLTTVPVYATAGQYVRSSLSYSAAHSIDARWKIVQTDFN